MLEDDVEGEEIQEATDTIERIPVNMQSLQSHEDDAALSYNDAEDNVAPDTVDGEELDYFEDERIMDELINRFQRLTQRHSSRKKIKRYSCLCHLLQLVMVSFDKMRTSRQREGIPLPLYIEAIQAARQLVGKFNKSTVATTRLEELCNKKLVADVSTRWSLVYLLIHRLLQLRKEVKVVCDELNWDCLSNTEWNLISRVDTLLEPFASYTKLVSADLIPTFSSVIPCVEELKFHLAEVSYLKKPNNYIPIETKHNFY